MVKLKRPKVFRRKKEKDGEEGGEEEAWMVASDSEEAIGTTSDATMIQAPADSRRVVESLLGDLRSLSTEAKKKHNHVKEAAEAAVVKVRNISTSSSGQAVLQNMRAASSELLHPLTLGCGTKQSRLVQISLQGIQRLVQHRILEPNCAGVVVSELWSLMEAECEELRLLQTVTPFVSTELVATGSALAKCIVLCFRLNFAKDPIVINAASASVRQLVACVYERVIQEDGMKQGELSIVAPTGGKQSARAPPPTLRPCAADAYMLFKDLCLLINGEKPVWLVGIQEMTRTLGLELLESVLKGYPSIFFKHTELAALLRDEVCPLVIKLFSPNLKNVQLSSQHPSSRHSSSSSAPPTSPDRPYFPIAMRLVRVVVVLIQNYHQILATECEIFVSLLLKFLEADKRVWQRALALEALHRVTSQPHIVGWLCEYFDMRSSSKVLQQLTEGLAVFVKGSFVRTHLSSGGDDEFEQSAQFGNAGFYHNGTWIPLVENLTPKKSVLLESMERHEAGPLPDGYCVSRAAAAMLDMTSAVFAACDAAAQREANAENQPAQSVGNKDESDAFSSSPPPGGSAVERAIFASAYPALLTSLAMLLQASTDEATSEGVLASVSLLVSLACRLGEAEARQTGLYVMCAAALPANRYLPKYVGIPLPEMLRDVDTDESGGANLSQVVSTGTPCPSPHVSVQDSGRQVMLTAKNVQCARVLLGCVSSNASQLGEAWLTVLAACQHVAWLLAMRPGREGLYSNTEGEPPSSGSSTVTVTTAAQAQTPGLAIEVDKLIAGTARLDEVSLHHCVNALCALSSEALQASQTGREPSLFPLAKLLHLGTANLSRLPVYWRPLTAHLTEACSHSLAPLRLWAAASLCQLVRAGLKAQTGMEEVKRQQLVLHPLAALCEVELADVRRKQMDCLMAVLQSDGNQIEPPLWALLIEVVASIVDKKFSFDDQLIKHAYLSLRLLAADFLQTLPLSCVEQLVEAVARYGQQHADHNISLSALTQLWTISDFVFRRSEAMGAETAERVWLVLYTCVSELCVDGRPPVRKSACQTMLQTVAAHGHALGRGTWRHMIWQILLPMLDRVRAVLRGASTEKSSSSLLIHHSRDTEAKQWTETAIQTMGGVCKIFNAQRGVLLGLDDFPSAWLALLSYLEWAAACENAELSLSAIKCFQEVLLGKVSAQTLDINTREKSTANLKDSVSIDEAPVPQLPASEWIVSWKAWQRMCDAVCAPREPTDDGKVYTAGPSHLTTLLHIFPPLFERVRKQIGVEEIQTEGVVRIFKNLLCVRVPSEQMPFVLSNAASQMTPLQEAVTEACKAIFAELCSASCTLRPALPHLIRLELHFASLAVTPTQAPTGCRDQREWQLSSVIPFGEGMLRMAVEHAQTSAMWREAIDNGVAGEVVEALGSPLECKYQCVSASTWKLAAHSLISLLKTMLPIARHHAAQFVHFWPTVADVIERFIFSPNGCARLNADERKRDEYIDCQLVELIGAEMLPFSAHLPPSFVDRLIAILNRGSVSTLDASDVLGSEAHRVRSDLARCCFDVLLAMSRVGGAGGVANGGGASVGMGAAAVASLVDRCKQVLSSFVVDWRAAGDLGLPQSRAVEAVAALNAVHALIDSLAGGVDTVGSSLYSQLVSLHPTLVDVVPAARNPQVEQALISSLKAYQTLLLLKSVPRQAH